MSKRPSPSNDGKEDVGGGGGGVISLIEEEERQINEALRRSLLDLSGPGSSSSKRQRRIRPSSSPNSVISLLSDDDDDEGDDDGGGKLGPSSSTSPRKRPAVKFESGGSSSARIKPDPAAPATAASRPIDDNDDDIMIVDKPTEAFELFSSDGGASSSATAAASSSPSSTHAKAASTMGGGGDDEIEEIGRSNVQRLPHNRQDCPDHKFVDNVLSKYAVVDAVATTGDGPRAAAAQERRKQRRDRADAEVATNRDTCDLCYCWVCDMPASECQQWCSTTNDNGDSSTSSSSSMKDFDPERNHCHASDRGNDRDRRMWQRMRDVKKGKAVVPSPSSGGASSDPLHAFLDQLARSARQVRAAQSLGAQIARARTAEERSSRARVQDYRDRNRTQRMLESLYGGGGSSPSSSAAAATGSSSARGRSSLSRSPARIRRDASDDNTPTPALEVDGMRNILGIPASSSARLGSGPFAPDSGAESSSHLTECRHCGWYSRFEHRNFSRSRVEHRYVAQPGGRSRREQIRVKHLHPVGDLDWCHSCGRIADERDFGKEQAKKYTPSSTDVPLGTLVVPFRIRSHDPRKIDQYRSNWVEHGSEWTYDEADMDEDTFRHRLGKRPTLSMILASIPIVDEKALPETGVLSEKESEAYLWNRSDHAKRREQPSVTETEAILLESRNHRALFEELHHFDAVGIKKTNQSDDYGSSSGSRVIGGEIKAYWNKEERKGKFKITLFLKQSAFVDQNSFRWSKDHLSSGARFSALLGTWFNVFPFSLVELTHGLKVKSTSERSRNTMNFHSLPIPPFSISGSDRERYMDESEEERRAIESHNAESKRIRVDFSFVSSTGTSSGGAICDKDTTFEGTLRRYCSARVAGDTSELSTYGTKMRMSWVGRSLGVVSHHRSMRRAGQDLHNNSSSSESAVRSYVRDSDHALLAENFRSASASITERAKTLSGLMQLLENLGHAPATVDGLTVDLLDFQRQAVGWAVERENTEGGIQAYLWTKLPLVNHGSKSTDVYYSPVFDMFSMNPPRIARGGIIAEEMGLGKTVISLALVLQNPAPETPESGTLVSDFTEDEDEPSSNGWTPTDKLEGSPKDLPKTRGSIFSRGTLVVCKVSLVGQWIDEARSKLKDPGLVYSYHGGKRNRDADVLATNAIVVTTYETLQSDTFRIAKKKGDDYCPPCEKIRWWRIICDESHVMKDANTQNSKALRRLVGENKWCVSGTPMNTTINDLKSQLRFIGVEHTDPMFSLFDSTMRMQGLGKGRGRRRWSDYRYSSSHEFGRFLFVMRSIMMRHTMKQKHRANSRDLMSLPPREERSVVIKFSDEERQEYDTLEKAAISFYNAMKANKGHKLSKYYLRLFQALTPLRIACSGGHIPDNITNDEADVETDPKLETYEMGPDECTECSICLDPPHEPRATRCNPVAHIFCKECIEGVIGVNDDSNGPCPMCREQVQLSKLRRAVLPKPTLEDDEENLDGGKSKKRKKDEPADNAFFFRSKYLRLLEELKRIRDEEPEAKSLVFSQFTSTLKFLQRELPKSGFEFRTLSGDMPMAKRAKALRDFQQDPPTTIFLLSMRAGAVGINLTQANRVFVLEPAMNPALEAQAIGRVHRLGQKKPVSVIRFFMENSVETRMRVLLDKKYGSKTGTENGEDENKEKVASGGEGDPHQDEDTSSSSLSSAHHSKNDKNSSTVLGNLARDKAQIVQEEFDALFLGN